MHCPGKDLVREYDSLSPVHILKRKDLSQQIDVLDTRIAKLKKKDARILKTCGKTKHSEMLALQEHVVKTRAVVQNHPAAKARQESIIDRAITVLKDLFILLKCQFGISSSNAPGHYWSSAYRYYTVYELIYQ